MLLMSKTMRVSSNTRVMGESLHVTSTEAMLICISRGQLPLFGVPLDVASGHHGELSITLGHRVRIFIQVMEFFRHQILRRASMKS